MPTPDHLAEWRTYSDLWREVELPRGLLDQWVYCKQVRQLALDWRNRADLPFLEGKPDGGYYCWDDISPLWDDYRTKDALRRLGDDSVGPLEQAKVIAAGPFGWSDAKARRR